MDITWLYNRAYHLLHGLGYLSVDEMSIASSLNACIMVRMFHFQNIPVLMCLTW